MSKYSHYVQDSSFTPSIWLHPLRQDEAGCERAKGNFLHGVLQSYDRRPSGGEGDSHFFTVLVDDTNLKEAQVYVAGDGGKGSYTPVGISLPEVYSLRAPGNLFYQLKKYASDANWTNVPLLIEYLGLKEIETEGKKGPMTVKAHQYKVTREPSFAPMVGQRPVMQIAHETPAEEPLG